MDLFKEIYKNYSGSKRSGGEAVTMTVEEFTKVFEDAGLLNEAFNIRNAGAILNQSLQTTIDETKSFTHKHCRMIEFVEAFARAADALSYPPPDEIIVAAGEDFTYNP